MALEVASLFATIEAKDTLTGALKSAKGGLSSFSDSLGGAMSTLGKFAGALGLAFGGAAFINQASQFESTMKNIQVATGNSSEAISGLQHELIGIGSNSIAGSQKVAESFLDIASAVEDSSTHMAILNNAIALSEGSQADLAVTTDGLITAINTYGFSADQAGFATDVMMQAWKKGKGPMNDMIAALSPIASTMEQAGISFEDFGAMASFMTTKGQNWSKAATGMQAATTALLNPNKKMEAALRKAGITSGSAAIKQYGLAKVLMMVQDALGGSTDAMTQALGSTEALGAAAILANDEYFQFADGFKSSMGGITDAARAVQLQSFSAQFEIFKNKLLGGFQELGALVIPILGKMFELINFGMGLVGEFGSNWKENFGGLGEFVMGAYSAIKPGLDLISGAVETFFAELRASKEYKTGPMFEMEPHFLAGTDVDQVIREVGFGERLQKAIEAAGPGFQAGLKNLFEGAAGWIRNVGVGILVNGIVPVFNTAVDSAGKLLTLAVIALAPGLIQLSDAARQFIGNVLAGIGTGLSRAGDAARQIVVSILTGMGNALSNAADAARKIVAGILTGIGDGLAKAAQAVRDAFAVATIVIVGGLYIASLAAINLGKAIKEHVVDTINSIDARSLGFVISGFIALAGILAVFKIATTIQAIVTAIQAMNGAALLGSIAWLPIIAIVGLLTYAAATNFGGFGDRLTELGDTLRKLGPLGVIAAIGFGLMAISLGQVGIALAGNALATLVGTLGVAIGGAATALGGLMIAAAPVLIILGLIGGLVAAYLGNWGGFRDTVDRLGGAFRRFGDALKPVSDLLWSIVDAIAKITGSDQTSLEKNAGIDMNEGLDRMKKEAGITPGGKAHGGLVHRGTPYLVGDQAGGNRSKGELFIPGMAGSIIPHNRSVAALAGAGGSGVYIANLIVQGVETDAQLFDRIEKERRRRNR